MRNQLMMLPVLAAAALAAPAQEKAAVAPPAEAAAKAPELALPTDPAVIKADSSLAFGFQFGQIFKQQLGSHGVEAGDVDMENFSRGFRKSISGENLAPDEEKRLGAALQALDKVLRGRLARKSAPNEAAGEKFLAENKQKAGVKVTASGLQYEVLKEGKGAKYEGDGSDNPRFLVRYEGRFLDGKKFDGDMQGQPATFSLQVVPGFREALMTMPAGSTWRLFVPSKLAYGERGSGDVIPPGSTLIFDLELIEILKAPAQSAAAPGQ